MPSDILYGRVANFRADVARLAAHYDDVISKVAATQYHDNNASYEGWAITSRDGTTADGVRRIERGAAAAAPIVESTPTPAPAPAPSGKGTVPTLLHAGALADTLDQLAALGLRHFRARVMRLSNEGFEMKWHRDADKESWRLHVPILTNPHSVFEWKLDDGAVHRIHMPADGAAWLIRVDKLHRAINNGPPGATRVHLLMSLGDAPRPPMIESPFRIPA